MLIEHGEHQLVFNRVMTLTSHRYTDISLILYSFISNCEQLDLSPVRDSAKTCLVFKDSSREASFIVFIMCFF